ncbi:MAG TPA: 50S ribosomal protein L7ae-like protein [Firmicutes bacterium]|nr:50S ribosomal protein L7ae-like protein [Candidatus Fermentithermobacillaceae bacterium]
MVGPAYGQISKKYKIAGVRAALKAIDRGLVSKVLVAEDAEARVVADVLAKAKENNIEIIWVSSMRQLGEYCSISVGASCCALLKSYTK